MAEAEAKRVDVAKLQTILDKWNAWLDNHPAVKRYFDPESTVMSNANITIVIIAQDPNTALLNNIAAVLATRSPCYCRPYRLVQSCPGSATYSCGSKPSKCLGIPNCCIC